MKTINANPLKIDREYFVVDAKDLILGRLASKIASILRGKHKVNYSYNVDVGDFVIVLNSDQIKLTGSKEMDKIYYHHTGYPGGIKSITVKEQRKKMSTVLLYKAVKGMLPKGPLGRQMLRKIRIYEGSEYPHNPKSCKLINL